MKIVHKLLLAFTVTAILVASVGALLYRLNTTTESALQQVSTSAIASSEDAERGLAALASGRAAEASQALQAIATRQSEAIEATKHSRDRTNASRVVAVTVIVLPFVAALLLGLSISAILVRRINRLAGFAERIGEGELDTVIEVKGHDELSDLGHGLNRMAEALRERTVSRDNFARILDSIADPVGVVDARGHTLHCNRAAEALFGVVEADVVGKPAIELFQMNEDQVLSFFSAISGSESVCGFETYYNHPDGTRVPLVLSGAKLFSPDGEVVGLVVVARDVTDSAAAREALIEAKQTAEAAAQAKSEFLANMSHEIRTPLNGVIGMTGFLLETELAQDQQEYAETIRSSGETLLALLNDILDFSKIEAGMLELEEHPFDVLACLEDSVDVVAYRASEKGIELGTLIEPGVPAAVRGDVTRLRQVLVNLLSNAVKFTASGEVVVRAMPCPEGLPEGLCLSVRDTGIGIPPDRLEGIFEEFAQADASTTRKYGGTGLGLAITRRLVDAMGGRIWAESEAGVGTTFYVAVPLERVEGVGRAPLPGAETLAGRRVLVVDDTATNRRILTLQAEKWDMLATVVASGAEALDALEEAHARGETFDLALLDYHMPEMDGVDLATRIKAEHPSLPLVMLSSLSQSPPARDGLLSAYLTKPIKQSHLCRVLIDALAHLPTTDSVPSVPPVDLAAPASEALLAPQEAGLHLLVAEDNTVNQRVVGLALDRLGHRATFVADGQEAIDAARQGRYDAILMDVRMPRVDGVEATRRIRADASISPQPPIIAMTADVTLQQRSACLDAGMDAFLAKPLQRDELAAALCTLTEVAPEASGEAPIADAPIDPIQALADAVGELVGDDPSHLRAFLGELRSDLERETVACGIALRDGDYATAGRVGHTLASIADLLHVAPLAEASRAVRDAADKNDAAASASAFLKMRGAAVKAETLVSGALASLMPREEDVMLGDGMAQA